ncbi:hypothetical protein G6F55_014578 [Rhizopus delemar]|nr:hypothetical protein G6F55_014578 [Rhizopus delemar]
MNGAVHARTTWRSQSNLQVAALAFHWGHLTNSISAPVQPREHSPLGRDVVARKPWGGGVGALADAGQGLAGVVHGYRPLVM